MLTGALFLIAKKWKGIKCLLIQKWINKMWFKKKKGLAILYRGQYLLMTCQFYLAQVRKMAMWTDILLGSTGTIRI